MSSFGNTMEERRSPDYLDGMHDLDVWTRRRENAARHEPKHEVQASADSMVRRDIERKEERERERLRVQADESLEAERKRYTEERKRREERARAEEE